MRRHVIIVGLLVALLSEKFEVLKVDVRRN
jgi:hypothetical protein